MTWLYTISAVSAPRLLMRVVLVFDQQQLTLSSLDLRCDHPASAASLKIRVDCGEALARRIHAKLFHLNDVLDVQLVEEVVLQVGVARSSAGNVFRACS